MKNPFLLAFAVVLVACAPTEPSQGSQTIDFTLEHTFTKGIEGPAVDAKGNLFAVNAVREGTIGIVSSTGEVSVLTELPNNSIGNGIRFDKNGNMFIADYVNHNILKIDVSQLSGMPKQAIETSVFAHNDAMNQPNDLAIMDNGTLFASDPNWDASTGKLWRVTPAGDTELLEADMGTTNGVEVSPDNKTLYVNESHQRNVWRYALDAQGNISNKQLLIKFEDHGLDGMRTDVDGNLYIARYGAGAVAIVSPKGELLKEIELNGQFPTNVAFGGPDGKTLFVTMQKRGAVEATRVNAAGRAYVAR